MSNRDFSQLFSCDSRLRVAVDASTCEPFFCPPLFGAGTRHLFQRLFFGAPTRYSACAILFHWQVFPHCSAMTENKSICLEKSIKNESYQLWFHQLMFLIRVVEEMPQVGVVQAVVGGNVVGMPFFVETRLAMLSRCTWEHGFGIKNSRAPRVMSGGGIHNSSGETFHQSFH